MLVSFSGDGSLAALEQLLGQVSSNPDVRSLLVLGCEVNLPDPMVLQPLLQAQQTPLIGGLFPRILHGRTSHEHGWGRLRKRKIKHAKPLLTQMFDCSWHFHHGNCNCPTESHRLPWRLNS